jgi:hypothetical protein
MPPSASSTIVSNTSLIISGSSAEAGPSNNINCGRIHNFSGNRHTLLLAAGQLPRIFMRLLRNLNSGQKMHAGLFGLGARCFAPVLRQW